MSGYTSFGYGDTATWPAYYGHPNDPRAPDDVDCTDDDEWTNVNPCPFCGSSAYLDETQYGTFVVTCETCESAGPRRTDPHEAADAWNSRA